jgi:DNA-binding winged helix-turn-helix (wHTH) protein
MLPEVGRMELSGSADNVLLEGFRLDRRGGCLFRLDQGGMATPVALGARGLNLLSLLIERKGELVSKDAIMKAVWPGRVVEEANLNVQIAKLRHILDQNRKDGSCIQTMTGRGYLLCRSSEAARDRGARRYFAGGRGGAAKHRCAVSAA